MKVRLKKWLLSAACALPFFGSTWAANGDEAACMRLVRQADSCFFAGDFRQAARFFDRAFAYTPYIRPQYLSNAAEANALAGDSARAVELLWQRYGQYPDWYTDVIGNPSFANLRTDTRFVALQDSMSARRQRIEANYDVPLKDRLQRIARADQNVRRQFLEAYGNPTDTARLRQAAEAMRTVDAANLAAITHILDSCGWVGRDRVGEATQAFWLVIQHADMQTRQKYLPMMLAAAQRGDIERSAVAMTEDRIAVFNGLPQKYGTQLTVGDDGRKRLCPLVDESRVDEWRAEVGLPSLDAYLEMMNVPKEP